MDLSGRPGNRRPLRRRQLRNTNHRRPLATGRRGLSRQPRSYRRRYAGQEGKPHLDEGVQGAVETETRTTRDLDGQLSDRHRVSLPESNARNVQVDRPRARSETQMRVLISGAGPAGLTAAYWLGRYGFRPTI